MKIVGCDLHTRYQQVAMLDEETGELVERRLEHASGEAQEFTTNLAGGWPALNLVTNAGCPILESFFDSRVGDHEPR
jgi:hypothetical protein